MALGAALTLIVFSLKADFSHWGNPEWPLTAVFLGDRTVTLVLAIFLLALCAFLAWFLVPIKRNCAYFSMGLGLIFITRSAIHFIRNAMGDDVTWVTNVLQLVCSAGTFFTWAALVNPAGETQKVLVGRRTSPAQVEAAIQRAAAAAGLVRGDRQIAIERTEDSMK
jgi:hypothetical protein